MGIEIRGLCPLLQVFDMPASIQFYCGILGFKIFSQSKPGDEFDWAWLKCNGAELMLNTAYESQDRPPAPDPARVAAHNDTAIYFGCPDVDAAYQYLCGKGVQAKPPANAPYAMRQLYLKDPDGYCLCFQWPAN